jgi:hypothetical protein
MEQELLNIIDYIKHIASIDFYYEEDTFLWINISRFHLTINKKQNYFNIYDNNRTIFLYKPLRDLEDSIKQLINIDNEYLQNPLSRQYYYKVMPDTIPDEPEEKISLNDNTNLSFSKISDQALNRLGHALEQEYNRRRTLKTKEGFKFFL